MKKDSDNEMKNRDKKKNEHEEDVGGSNQHFDQYDALIKSIKIVQDNVLKSAQQLRYTISPFQEKFKQLNDSLAKYNFSFFEDIKKMQINTNILHITQNIVEALKGTPLSEKEQQKIVEKAKKYADCGIPFPFDEPLGNVYKINPDKKYVEGVCRKYATGKRFDAIKQAMYGLDYKNEQQVSEAISCFKHGEYYACCCLLFAIIDREIISSQPVKKKARRKPYDKKLIDDRLEAPENENHFWLFFWKVNFMLLLSLYYKDGKDFVSESETEFPVINRNFIDHGMTNRIVTKNDCVKLFLFIYMLKQEIKNVI